MSSCITISLTHTALTCLFISLICGAVWVYCAQKEIHFYLALCFWFVGIASISAAVGIVLYLIAVWGLTAAFQTVAPMLPCVQVVT